MKVLILIVLSLTALAKAEIDWSKLKPAHVYVQPKGLLPPQPRVVGGELAVRGQFPHQVALFTNINTFCGGSLIKDNVVLTAAHCLDLNGISEVTIHAGINNLRKPENTAQIRVAPKSNFIIHSGWNSSNVVNGNDVALIRLQEAFKLGDYVKLVALYRGNSALDNVQATVSGWGRFSDQNPSISDKLQYATSNILSNAKCSVDFKFLIPGIIVCLNGQGGKSACNGDSGGPLHIAENNKLYQAGLVSFGSSLGCQIGYPSAYTRVSSFISWIDKNMPK